MQTILITGGAGFVGSHLALRMKAAREDRRVVALDNLKRRGSELNLPRLRAGGVEFVHGDVRAMADLDGIGRIDHLLECSAEPSVLAGFDGSPRYVIDTNLGGAINCLELACRHGAGFLFLSTSRVYPMAALRAVRFRETATRLEVEASQSLPGISAAGVSEAFPLNGARSLYGATKLASELLMQEYLEMYGMRGVINRCGVLSGPWQMGKVDQGFLVLWASRHLYGGSLQYIGLGGSGRQVRDVLHVDDLYRLVEHQLEHLDALSGEIFNVGGGPGNSTSLRELTDLCTELSGRKIVVGADPADRAADIPYYVSDCGRVREATGWQPEIGLPALVEEVCRWLRDNEAALRPILA